MSVETQVAARTPAPAATPRSVPARESLIGAPYPSRHHRHREGAGARLGPVMHQPSPSPFHASAQTLQGLDRKAARRTLAGTVVRSLVAVGGIVTAYYVAPLKPEAA